MLQPLLMMLVFQMVFSSIFRFDRPNYPIYALAGILFWNFFSQSIVASMNSLKGNAQLLQKLPVPKAVFPIATVISGVVNLVLALVPLFFVLWFLGFAPSSAIFFLPVAILIVATFTLGAGLLLSPLAVFFADVVEMVSVLLTLLMYLTPIIYPYEVVPDKYRWIVRYNPLRSILETFRDPIYQREIPPFQHIAVSVGIALAALAIGTWAFRRSSDRIPFYF